MPHWLKEKINTNVTCSTATILHKSMDREEKERGEGKERGEKGKEEKKAKTTESR